MRRSASHLTLVTLSLVCVLILVGCGDSTPILRYVTISPQTATGTVGSTVTFTATAYYSNGTIQSATGLVTWGSSNPAVASVVGGVATPLSNGTTTITAAAAGTPGATATLTVNTLTSITVTPVGTTVPLGGTQQYDAMASFSDGSTGDVTTLASWSTSDSTNIPVGAATGLVTVNTTATLGETATVYASLYGVTGSTTLTVGAAAASTLVISTTPATPTVAVGNSVALLAQEQYTDGTLHNPANTVVWANATPTAAGLVTLTTSPNSDTAVASGITSGGSTQITATDGSLTTNVTVNVAVGSAQYAYVSNSGDSTIGWYTVNASAGTFTSPQVSSTLSQAPFQTVIDPSGLYMYYTDFGPSVNSATITASSGAIATTGSPINVGSSGTASFTAVDPYGRFLYVSSSSDNAIYEFTINGGTLTAVSGSPYSDANLNAPTGLIIDRTGSYLYVTNPGPAPAYSGTVIAAYNINPTTGALTPFSSTAPSSPTFTTGAGPWSMGLDPSGTHLYVADSTANAVDAFTIGANGVLTEVGSAPTAISGASFVESVVVDPADANIYILDGGGSNGQIYGFALNNTTGALTSTAVSGTPIATGAVPLGIPIIDPTGALLANENNGDGTIYLFTIKSNAVSAASPAFITSGSGAASAPFFVTFYNVNP
jgi:trimeric autotransporter adhesin